LNPAMMVRIHPPQLMIFRHRARHPPIRATASSAAAIEARDGRPELHDDLLRQVLSGSLALLTGVEDGVTDCSSPEPAKSDRLVEVAMNVICGRRAILRWRA
jgi:hypothetical protein